MTVPAVVAKTAGSTVQLTKPPVHAVALDTAENVWRIYNSDNGRSHVSCADLTSAAKEVVRLNALSAKELF
jgi:hypothetical protein